MPFQLPDNRQDDEAWPQDEVGAFIYVPSAWRMGQTQLAAGTGPDAEIQGALKELHASYHDLPIPDRLLDLVRRLRAEAVQ